MEIQRIKGSKVILFLVEDLPRCQRRVLICLVISQKIVEDVEDAKDHIMIRV